MALLLACTKLPFRAFAREGFRAPTLLTPFLRQRAFPRPQRTIGVLRSSLPERASSPLTPFFIPNELLGFFAGLRELLGNLAGHRQTWGTQNPPKSSLPADLYGYIFASVLEEFARAAPNP